MSGCADWVIVVVGLVIVLLACFRDWFVCTGYQGVRSPVPREDVGEDGGERCTFARGEVDVQGQDQAAYASRVPHQAGTKPI